MDLSGLSWYRSCPGHLWEAAVIWAPAYSAVYLCLCLAIKRRVLQYRVIFTPSGSTLVLPGTRSHVSPHRLTSTTQPLCHCGRVYHNIHNSYKRVPVPRVLCHSLTELTEIPGKGMGFLRKFQKFWVRVRKCYRTHRSSEHVQK